MNWTAELEQKLKAHIERLHDRDSGDYQSLLDAPKRFTEVNLPQAYAALAPQLFVFLEWGRGTGKTTELARQIFECVTTMPRSTGLFIVPNYQFGLSRIIPSLVKGLAMFGLYENLHFFIGQRPPRRWRKSWGRAYEPPADYKRYITFWNGTGMHLISHDVPGDGRGLNTDWIIGDEAALLDPSKLQENTDPTRRGTNQNVFGGSRYLGLRKYVSSTPITPAGRWMIEYEDKAVETPDKIAYLRATCKHNLHNLRPGYLAEEMANSYKLWVAEAEYLGIRPKWTKDSFYPLFDSDVHCYRHNTIDGEQYLLPGGSSNCRGDQDLTRGVPLTLGVDFGAAINSVTINQHLRSINEYRTLNAMYVLGEDQKIQEDLFNDFHDYYQPHQSSCNIINLWYDNTGNAKTGITKRTRAQQIKDQLDGKGWHVNLMTTGIQNPMHEDKYNLWTLLCRGDHPNLPRYRMNFFKTEALRASMSSAKAKPGRNGEIKKDKSSESSTKIKRQHATDLSDANDSPVYGLFAGLMRGRSGFLPAPRVRTRR